MTKRQQTTRKAKKKPQAKPAASAKPRANAANKRTNAEKRAVQTSKAAATPPKAKSEKKRSRKTTGFAETKEYPHKKHPAKFKKKRGSDDIEYITFTHSDKVEFDDVVVITRPLTSNINPSERGTLNKDGKPNISYVYPKVYIGKRSALGKGTDKYSLIEADKKIVDELFATLPKEEVPKTSNSKKNSKKKK